MSGKIVKVSEKIENCQERVKNCQEIVNYCQETNTSAILKILANNTGLFVQ